MVIFGLLFLLILFSLGVFCQTESKPYLGSGNVTVTIGETVNLTCGFSDYPEETYVVTWRHDGNTIGTCDTDFFDGFFDCEYQRYVSPIQGYTDANLEVPNTVLFKTCTSLLYHGPPIRRRLRPFRTRFLEEILHVAARNCHNVNHVSKQYIYSPIFHKINEVFNKVYNYPVSFVDFQ